MTAVPRIRILRPAVACGGPVGGVQQARRADQGRPQEGEGGGRHGRPGEGGDQGVGAGSGGDLAGEPAAGQQQERGGPEGAGNPRRPARAGTGRPRPGAGPAAPISRASSSAHGTAESGAERPEGR